jgi:oxygen-independent coproporphyrinogen-3 oxidase
MAGIYIHIPFCKQACHYCDFHFSTSLKNKDRMLWALHQELAMRAQDFSEVVVETVYFGGGTPSLLSVAEIEQLLATLRKEYRLVEAPEITLEANPDDLDAATLKALGASPVNRLSIGVQSFFEEDLQMMNRAHAAVEAENCVATAARYFDKISIDLMYGVPGLSAERWRQNLQKAFDLGVTHISSYALTVEDNTALSRFIQNKSYPPLDDALALAHFQILVEETKKQGFVQYEVSNFAKPNCFSKHNTSYWKGVPYLGIGPSAHSFSGSQRAWNVANNAKYLRAIENKELAFEIETLSVTDRYNEYVMTGLRTVFGVSLEKVHQDFGTAYVAFLTKEMGSHIDAGTLELVAGVLKATPKGMFLVDGVASELFCLESL